MICASGDRPGLETGKKVIPVLFDDTLVPPADHLPEPLRALARCDALTLRGKTYEYDTQRRELVRLLTKVARVPEAGEAIAGPAVAQLPGIIEAAKRPRARPAPVGHDPEQPG